MENCFHQKLANIQVSVAFETQIQKMKIKSKIIYMKIGFAYCRTDFYLHAQKCQNRRQIRETKCVLWGEEMSLAMRHIIPLAVIRVITSGPRAQALAAVTVAISSWQPQAKFNNCLGQHEVTVAILGIDSLHCTAKWNCIIVV